MTTRIEKELQEAVDFEAQKGEKRQPYLKRLIEAVDELSDTEFGRLSKEAQVWAEAAAKASLASESISDFEPDEDEDEPSEDETEASEGESEGEPEEKAAKPPRGSNGTKHVKKSKKVPDKVAAKPAKTAKGATKPAKATKDKPARAAQARPRGSLPTGRNKYVQEVLCNDPNASIEDIVKVLEKKGVPVPSRITISTSRSSFRSALETLNRKGMLKEPVDLSGRN